MIDTEKMYASISKIRHIFGDDVRATQSLGEVFELITRLREAEKDAERYRWLKGANSDWCSPVMVAKGFSSYDGVDLIDDVDAYIDQAMKEKGDE